MHAVLQLALSRRAKEIAANGGANPDRGGREALISRLKNAPTRTWQWIIKDEKTLARVGGASSNPNRSGRHVSADEFLDQVAQEDRDRIISVFNEAIRGATYRDCIQEEKRSGDADGSLIAVGCVTQNDEGSLQFSGIEISALGWNAQIGSDVYRRRR